MRTRVLTWTTVLVSLIAGAVISPVGAHADASCGPDYVFVGARGSGELQSADDGLGKYGLQVWSDFKSAVQAQGKTATEYDVQYNAVTIDEPTILGILAHTRDRDSYYNSVSGGIADVKQEVDNIWQSCASTKIVAFGYSQGAEVVGDALTQLSASQDPALAAIASVDLLGDPEFNPGDVVADAGSFSANYFGFFGQRTSNWSSVLNAPVHSYCDDGDFVCNIASKSPFGALTNNANTVFDIGHITAIGERRGLLEASSSTGAGDPFSWAHTHYENDRPKVLPYLANQLEKDADLASVGPTSAPLDVAVVIDATQNGEVLGDTQGAASQLVDEISSESPDAQIGVEAFQSQSGSYASEVVSPLTSDTSSVESAIAGLQTAGNDVGNDGEPVGFGVSGMYEALNSMGWRPDARRVMVVVYGSEIENGSNNYTDPEINSGLTLDDVISLAERLQVTVMSAKGEGDDNYNADNWADGVAISTGGWEVQNSGPVEAEVPALNQLYSSPVAVVSGPSSVQLTDPAIFNALASYDSNPQYTITDEEWSIQASQSGSPQPTVRQAGAHLRSQSTTREPTSSKVSPRHRVLPKPKSSYKQVHHSKAPSTELGVILHPLQPHHGGAKQPAPQRNASTSSASSSSQSGPTFVANFPHLGDYTVELSIIARKTGGAAGDYWTGGAEMDVEVVDSPTLPPAPDSSNSFLDHTALDTSILRSDTNAAEVPVYSLENADGSSLLSVTPDETSSTNKFSFQVSNYTDVSSVVPQVVRANTAGTTPANAYDLDTFDRSTATGLGSADVGGAWSLVKGDPSKVFVGQDPNGIDEGYLGASAGKPTVAILGSWKSSTSMVSERFSLTSLPSSGSVSATTVARETGGGAYSAVTSIDSGGNVTLQLVNGAGAAVSAITNASLTMQPGVPLDVRVQASGTNPTSLAAKIWQDGTAEPSQWLVNGSDSSSAQQGAGTAGLGYAQSKTASTYLDVSAFSAGGASVANPAPISSFSASANGYAVSFNANASSDDGSIVSYLWNFGDGTSGTGVTATHVYSNPGPYTVGLTVQDDLGANGASSQSLQLASVFASDTFSRTTSSSLGNADIGGAWTVSAPTSNWSDDGSAAQVSTPSGATLVATLGQQKVQAAIVSTDLTLVALPKGGSAYALLIGRKTGSTNGYNARLTVSATGVASVQVMANTSQLATASLGKTPITAGTKLRFKVSVTGSSPSTIAAKVWLASAQEPTSWNVSASDSTAALQAPGLVGFGTVCPSTVTNTPLGMTFDNFAATAS